jgi:hypothetical protein
MAAKVRLMLGAQGLGAGRYHCHATSAVTRGLSVSGVILKTAPRILTAPHSVASYDTQGDVEDLF